MEYLIIDLIRFNFRALRKELAFLFGEELK